MLDTLFSKARWRQKRSSHMQAARECRATLIDLGSYWHYAPDDARVKAAVGAWVNRAREAHAISMGRRPVIGQAIVINHRGAKDGALYAE